MLERFDWLSVRFEEGCIRSSREGSFQVSHPLEAGTQSTFDLFYVGDIFASIILGYGLGFFPWAYDPLKLVFFSVNSVHVSDYSNRNDGWLRICLSGFLLVFPLVVMNSLNSKLISALTIKRDEDFINKFEDVSRFPDVRVYCEAGSSFSVLFTVSSFLIFPV